MFGNQISIFAQVQKIVLSVGVIRVFKDLYNKFN